MKLLVTGGAGYVGSVVTAQLVSAGHEVVVLDDLSTGHADAIHPQATLVCATLADAAAEVLNDGGFEGVLHFAGKTRVDEAASDPGYYWDQNLGQTLALLEAMRQARVRRIVFSSTAAVYGEPVRPQILETDPTRPMNAYGASKLAIDTTLTAHARLHGLGAVSLRYFNVAGALGRYGERHRVETHLVPNVLRVAMGLQDSVHILGTDYDTPDGTGIRDYIHVVDLGLAHFQALAAATSGTHQIFNLGNGSGFSVREVVDAARDVTGQPIPVTELPRRAGDIAIFVASSAKILAELGWKPERDLSTMIADAWTFMNLREQAS